MLWFFRGAPPSQEGLHERDRLGSGGASTDLNKSEIKAPEPQLLTSIHFVVVRSSYPDDFYTSLAQGAAKAWKDEGEWGNHYREFASLPSPFMWSRNEPSMYEMSQDGGFDHGGTGGRLHQNTLRQ